MAKTPLTPVGKRIVVQPATPEEVTKSGIIIPDSAKKERSAQGKVIAIGEKLEGVTVGNTVFFAKYGPEEVHVGNEVYFVVEHKDVVAVLA
jgi:chaperonin GroES